MKDSKSRAAELLFREEESILSPAAKELYNGKTILVTGGGGSIGSELCRQISKFKPKKLIILSIRVLLSMRFPEIRGLSARYAA